MTNPLAGSLAALIFVLTTTAWLQFTGAVPIGVPDTTHFMAILVAGILALVSYMWADSGY